MLHTKRNSSPSFHKICCVYTYVHSHLINPHISPKSKETKLVVFRYAIFSISTYLRDRSLMVLLELFFVHAVQHFIDTSYHTHIHTLVASSGYSFYFLTKCASFKKGIKMFCLTLTF